MRSLKLFLFSIVLILLSCNPPFPVVLSDKSIVNVNYDYGKDIKSGDSVCIFRYEDGASWYLSNYGFFKDTITFEGSINGAYYKRIFRIGVAK